MRLVVRSAAPASAPERGQHALVEIVELVRLERVRRERAHHLAAFGQRAAEARVHLVQRARRRFDDAIERDPAARCPPETAPARAS